MIPRDSPSCYDSTIRNLVALFIHFIATLAQLLGPGGVRSIVAESLLLKPQLPIVIRSRQRSPNPSEVCVRCRCWTEWTENQIQASFRNRCKCLIHRELD